MDYRQLVSIIADILKEFDSENPVHKSFRPGIGPFGEPQLVKEVCQRLNAKGIISRTKRTPDMELQQEWAIEFKIVRPFGDNGKEAEDWSVNMLHPYKGSTSLIVDAMKLRELVQYRYKALCVIGFEHAPPRISLDPLLDSFELIIQNVINVKLGVRIEERRDNLVHPEHEVLRCIGWELT